MRNRAGRLQSTGRGAVRWALAALIVAAAAGLSRAAVYRAYPFPYAVTVRTAARAAGVDPLLALAVMRTESGFRVDVRSSGGALGIMQITPATAAWAALERGSPAPDTAALLDPEYNIRAGIWYLGSLWRRFPGLPAAAVAAYNAGPGPVVVWLHSGRWRGSLRTVEAVPFPETRRFVQRVFGALGVYRMLYRTPGPAGGDTLRHHST